MEQTDEFVLNPETGKVSYVQRTYIEIEREEVAKEITDATEKVEALQFSELQLEEALNAKRAERAKAEEVLAGKKSRLDRFDAVALGSGLESESTGDSSNEQGEAQAGAIHVPVLSLDTNDDF